MANEGASVSIKGMKELQARFAALRAMSPEVAKQEIAAGALAIQGRMKRLVTGAGGGRVYKRRGVTHRASAPYKPPATDQATLLQHLSSGDAVTYRNGGLQAEIGPRNYPVALYLEYGTKRMAPRPFAFRAFEMERRGIVRNMGKSMKALVGIKGGSLPAVRRPTV